MKTFCIEINEAYIIDPLLPCASLKVFTDKVIIEGKNAKQAKKQAIDSANYLYKKAHNLKKPDAIEVINVKEI